MGNKKLGYIFNPPKAPEKPQNEACINIKIVVVNTEKKLRKRRRKRNR